MRIPSIWYKHSEELEVDKWDLTNGKWKKKGTHKLLHNFIGGSNISESDAKVNALKKRDVIKSKIVGNYDYKSDYQVDIVEEIIGVVDEDNIITRNRYGALVLNSTSVVIIDVDDSSFKWQYKWSNRVWRKIADKLRGLSFRETIENHIHKTCRSLVNTNRILRVYRTPNGYRVMVIYNKSIPEGRSSEAKKLMRAFFTDWTYQHLCEKQNCYRARLTPKPWRVGVKRPKIIFPFRTPKEDIIHNDWVENYHRVSENYSACRFMKQYGKLDTTKEINYHDKFCKAFSSLPLA